jgi:serine/threonine protein kinase
MDYPLISEYIESIIAAEDNFEQLKHLRPVLDKDGNPVMSSGNFAVVFKMRDERSGKFHAVKCFLKEQDGRAEAYRLITEELSNVTSDYLTPIKYIDKELFVDSKNTSDTEFPVILMDWVEGTTLDKYLQKYVYGYLRAESRDEIYASGEIVAELLINGYELSFLAYQFSNLAIWLMMQPFAHGDLKPDNILVKNDGSLVLVDYDGMYVPAMKGQKARELGSPDFRHPLRTEDDFDEHIDDFPLSSILLSLLTISYDPRLLEEYGGDGRLLFSERDYCKLTESKVIDAIKPLIEDKDILTYLSLFYLCYAKKCLNRESFSLFELPEPEVPSFFVEEDLSTLTSDTDLEDSWEDEYKVLYGKDTKKLLKAPENLKTYTIRGRTIVVSDKAFFYCTELEEIIIPNSVKAIGDSAFMNCKLLQTVTIPQNIKKINNRSFCNCYALKKVFIPERMKVIGDEAFQNCSSLESIILPPSITKIGDSAFFGCESLKSFTIPEKVEEIGVNPIAGTGIKNIICNSSLFEIDDNALYNNGKKHLIALYSDIQHYEIPESVTTIGEHAFYYCSSLRTLIIPSSVDNIGQDIFWGCILLQSILVPKGTLDKFKRLIPNYAFKLKEV